MCKIIHSTCPSLISNPVHIPYLHIYYYHYTLCIRCLPVIIFNMIGTYWSYFIVADLTTIFASIIVYFCVHSAFI